MCFGELLDCPQPLEFSTQKRQTKRARSASTRREGGGKLLPFCAGVQFSRRSHRALIDRKKKHEKIEGCEQSSELLSIRTLCDAYHEKRAFHKRSILNIIMFFFICSIKWFTLSSKSPSMPSLMPSTE